MSNVIGERVLFNGAEATIVDFNKNGTCQLSFTGHGNVDNVDNVPMHLLKKIEPPPASAEEAIISVLKSVEAHLASIDATLKKIRDDA
jgi:hypothetical protein